MNRRYVMIALLLCANLLVAGKKKTVTLVPLNGTPVTIVVNEKEKEYYTLSPRNPVKLQVDGPGKLEVISRLKLSRDNADVQKYSVRVTEGKNTLKVQSTQTDKSDATFKLSQDVASKSRKFSLTIPDGSFTYEFFLDDTPAEAAVRFLLEPAKGRRNLVAIEPLSYDKIVTAKINENLIAYYVASRERGVQFRVVGPTRVEVNARLNYDQTMKGEQKYSLLVTEAGKQVAQKLLQTSKSVGLAYEDWKEVVPGKPNSVSITVPEGEHTYQITLGESIAQSVSLKFSIPKKDLDNE